MNLGTIRAAMTTTRVLTFGVQLACVRLGRDIGMGTKVGANIHGLIDCSLKSILTDLTISGAMTAAALCGVPAVAPLTGLASYIVGYFAGCRHGSKNPGTYHML